jgi:F420-dependent oxidoreductase-like protein
MPSKSPAFGIQIACDGVQWQELLDVAKAAEDCGYESAWTADHYVSTPDSVLADPRGVLLDGWMTLGALAMATKKMRLGPLVTGNLFRHPGVLAKMAATVDHISGGRLEFGMGAGWFAFEHQSLGLPWPGIGERLRRMEETVQIVKSLWTQDETTFQGRYYTLTKALSMPKPVQKPWPPIVIGAQGEKVALGIAARHAEHWNTYTSVDRYAQKAKAFETHCAALGRNPAEVKRSLMIPTYLWDTPDVKAKVERWTKMVRTTPEQARLWFLIGDKREIRERMDAYLKMGVQVVIIQLDLPGRGVQTVREFARRFM